MTGSQSSSLLPALFEDIDEGRCLTVLHVGAALPETVEFFSRYRCKLHFIDLFGELPLAPDPDEPSSLPQKITALMHLPAATRFDLCLFWDLFNFMDAVGIRDFLAVLRPHLHSDSRAHGFAVHNLKTPQGGQLYGIREISEISIRRRAAHLPGYQPRNQGQLEKVLDCFSFTRSVLLPDSRLEILLSARL